MERLKSLRTVIMLLSAIFVVELILLSVMIAPASAILWITIGTIAVAGLYMIVISWGLLKELKKREEEK